MRNEGISRQGDQGLFSEHAGCHPKKLSSLGLGTFSRLVRVGRGPYPGEWQGTSGGGRPGELAGRGWQHPKATGEGIWDRVGAVEETCRSVTEGGSLADGLHMSEESQGRQGARPRHRRGGRGREVAGSGGRCVAAPGPVCLPCGFVQPWPGHLAAGRIPSL